MALPLTACHEAEPCVLARPRAPAILTSCVSVFGLQNLGLAASASEFDGAAQFPAIRAAEADAEQCRRGLLDAKAF